MGPLSRKSQLVKINRRLRIIPPATQIGAKASAPVIMLEKCVIIEDYCAHAYAYDLAVMVALEYSPARPSDIARLPN